MPHSSNPKFPRKFRNLGSKKENRMDEKSAVGDPLKSRLRVFTSRKRQAVRLRRGRKGEKERAGKKGYGESRRGPHTKLHPQEQNLQGGTKRGKWTRSL